MLTERNRAVLHRRLTDVVGDEEAVSEMLSNFPNDPRLRPASEDFVHAEVNALGLRLIMWMIGIAVAAAAVVVTAMGILI
ncbi:MAG TPA: hypothetical protein VF228_00985 [Iamia sp.]